jgi:hypothetical protein
MEALTAGWRRVRTVFRRRQLQSDLEEEMQFHLAMRGLHRVKRMPPRGASSAMSRG